VTNYWFISTKYRQGSRLILCTFALAFVVILLGAYTRLTNAGLSCPDWPNCYGYITAPHTATQLEGAAARFPGSAVDVKKAWTEMTHRYFAGTEGILILILSCSILFGRKAKNLKTVTIATLLIVLLCVQVMLGMWTVTEKLKPVIVLLHLVTGLSILSLLWWAYLDLNVHQEIYSSRIYAPFPPFLWLALLIVAGQIILGGWVSTHYAGLACIDFPYCNGTLLPELKFNEFHTNLITIHMAHRIGALITAIYLSLLAIKLAFNPYFRSIAILIILLLSLQLTLGFLNIVWLLPVWIALAHHCVAILLLLTILTAIIKTSHITGNNYGF